MRAKSVGSKKVKNSTKGVKSNVCITTFNAMLDLEA